MRFSSRLLNWIGGHSFLSLLVILCVGLVMHLTTIDISPVHWMDEIQISEIAKGGIGSKSIESSLCLLRTDGGMDKQSWALYWLGGWFHGVAYGIFGHIGPRIFQMGWLVGLTLLVFLYAKRKTSDEKFSLFLAVAVFASPALCQSVRGGRVDAQSLFFGLLSLLIVAKSVELPTRMSQFAYVVAGASFSCAVFSWISALMLAPLVVNEMLISLQERRAKVHESVAALAFCGAGAVATALLLAMPFLLNFSETARTFGMIVSYNAPHDSVHFAWREFFVSFGTAPWFLMTGIIFMLCAARKNSAAVAGFVLFSGICIMTRVYIFRMLYFLPFAIVGFVALRSGIKRIRLCQGIRLLVGTMAIYSVVWSVVMRNASEMFARPSRNYEFFKSALGEKIGKGRGVSVYLDTFELGYVARELGWRANRLGTRHPTKELLSRSDYVIIKEGGVSKQMLNTIQEAGFVEAFVIDGQKCRKLSTMENLLARHKRLLPLGPYVVFSNEGNKGFLNRKK